MERLNKTTDVEKYLQGGALTMPFLNGEKVKGAVMCDYNAKLELGKDANRLNSLVCWIQHEVKYADEKDFISKNQFSRTAEEIWSSGRATGCTDYALIFATLARQLGYSCTLLHTSENKWLQRLLSGGDYRMHYGHTFCECFVDNEWILVDPTCNKVTKKYDTNLIKLDYEVVSGCNEYFPYLRNVDMGKKMTVKEFIQAQEYLSREL